MVAEPRIPQRSWCTRITTVPRARTGSGRAVAVGSATLIAGFALALSLTGGCVSSLSLDDAGCPCASGSHCCPVENRCLPAAEICPLSKNCPLPPAAQSIFEVGSTDISSPYANFLPLPAGGHLPLQRGGQGGYHVYLQVRIAGLDPVGLTLTRSLFDPADPARDPAHALRTQTSRPALVCDRDLDWLLLDEQRTFVCPTQTGAPMANRDLVLRLSATDREHRTATAEWTLHPDCPAGDALCAGDAAIGCAGR